MRWTRPFYRIRSFYQTNMQQRLYCDARVSQKRSKTSRGHSDKVEQTGPRRWPYQKSIYKNRGQTLNMKAATSLRLVLHQIGTGTAMSQMTSRSSAAASSSKMCPSHEARIEVERRVYYKQEGIVKRTRCSVVNAFLVFRTETSFQSWTFWFFPDWFRLA
jgi:hypothetical protein